MSAEQIWARLEEMGAVKTARVTAESLESAGEAYKVTVHTPASSDGAG
jgi:hypothetical protein